MLDLSRRCLDRASYPHRQERTDVTVSHASEVRATSAGGTLLSLIPRTTVSLSTQHTVSTGHWHSGQRAVVSIGTGRTGRSHGEDD